jgi:prevent-host-death family protein
MKAISIVDFRRHTKAVIAQAQKGQGLVLTRRGKPVARLKPILPETVHDDPFYSLDQLSDAPSVPLSNAQIDDILYGQ